MTGVMTVPAAAVVWITSDDTGISSKAIWAQMVGAPHDPVWGAGYPHDPSDFGRCYRLLERIPEWKGRMHEMAQYGPVWPGLIAAWDELTALWEEEIGPGPGRYYGKSAPRLYARMTEIQKAGWDAQKANTPTEAAPVASVGA
jgi:hypothetical protein